MVLSIIVILGMFVVDAVFDSLRLASPSILNQEITMIPGVVETGLFCGMADGAYFGMEDGSVKVTKYNKNGICP
jgi:ribose 5-phosphate isomerase A